VTATPDARTLCCPICGGPLHVERRQRHRPWTPAQIALAERLLDMGAGRKFVARALGATSATAVYESVWRRRPAS